MKQNKLSYKTAIQLIRLLRSERVNECNAMNLLNREEISIRIKDIDNDIKIISKLIFDYETNVNRGKMIIKGGGI